MSGNGQGNMPQNQQVSREMNRVFEVVELQGVRVTLTIVLAAFTLYALGWMPAFIPPENLIELLGSGVTKFVQEHNAPTGWQWLAMLDRSDMLTLGGLVMMVGVIFAAYVALVPVLVRLRQRLYLVLTLIQLGLFLLAGLGGPGGH